MLAIHLQRDLSTAGFNPNKQTHCTPLLATAIRQRLEAGSGGAPGGDGGAAGAAADGAAARHHPLLLRLLASELGCGPESIVDFDLNVVDTQPGVIGGAPPPPESLALGEPPPAWGQLLLPHPPNQPSTAFGPAACAPAPGCCGPQPLQPWGLSLPLACWLVPR
jgi:hypothetical protein